MFWVELSAGCRCFNARIARLMADPVKLTTANGQNKTTLDQVYDHRKTLYEQYAE